HGAGADAALPRRAADDQQDQHGLADRPGGGRDGGAGLFHPAAAFHHPGCGAGGDDDRAVGRGLCGNVVAARHGMGTRARGGGASEGMTATQQVRFWLIGAVVAGALIWLLSDMLLPFVAGLAIAYFLNPLTDHVEKLVKSRALATTLIVVV